MKLENSELRQGQSRNMASNVVTGNSNDNNYSSYMKNTSDIKADSEVKSPVRRSYSPYQRNLSPGRKKALELKR